MTRQIIASPGDLLDCVDDTGSYAYLVYQNTYQVIDHIFKEDKTTWIYDEMGFLREVELKRFELKEIAND